MSRYRRCYVYLIGRFEGPIKVGVSFNPTSRVSELQTGCPFKLELLAAFPFKQRETAMKIESTIHSTWVHRRLNGEWIDFDAELAYGAVSACLDLRGYEPTKENDWTYEAA